MRSRGTVSILTKRITKQAYSLRTVVSLSLCCWRTMPLSISCLWFSLCLIVIVLARCLRLRFSCKSISRKTIGAVPFQNHHNWLMLSLSGFLTIYIDSRGRHKNFKKSPFHKNHSYLIKASRIRIKTSKLSITCQYVSPSNLRRRI